MRGAATWAQRTHNSNNASTQRDTARTRSEARGVEQRADVLAHLARRRVELVEVHAVGRLEQRRQLARLRLGGVALLEHQLAPLLHRDCA